ncbi:MAG: S46 family peptidase, partial [Bacteroidota bacterium]|nr:S46 family peptidase [Bacteroidota bacterium]
MKNFKLAAISIVLIVALTLNLNAQRSIYEPLDISKTEFSFDDFGTMWTFDAVPKEDYSESLNFSPTDEWLTDVQKSALELGNGCSAAFVSSDGLIMTNHHCIRGRLKDIEQKGENLYKNGYYAKTLKDERIIPGLFADQLIEIKDATDAIHKAMEKGKTDNERIDLKEKKIEELEKKYSQKTGLHAKMITLYNGGKYSLHLYKRYNDLRLVMAPDVQIAATGWDWDNFTYPRYELDFAFLRAYDSEGNPVKVTHFFEWSEKGAETDEAVFVIGRPGNTDRLLSMKQLEYFRDLRHPQVLHRLNEVYEAYFEYYTNHPNKQAKLLSRLLSVANGRKAYAGMLMGLNDEYLMKKKYDFENKLKA